jgi:CRP/FNR family transcriptional regulator
MKHFATRRRPSCFESLRAMDLFSSVSDGDLRRLTERGSERRLERDGLLRLREEPQGPQLAVLVEGEAALIWGNGNSGDLLVRTLEPGDFAGQIELFDAHPCENWVRAAGTVRFMAWRREEVLRSVRECPDLALALLGGMARQQRHLHRRLAGVYSQRAPRRLARTLTALFEDRGIRLKDADGRRCLLLQRPPTRRRMGEIAGIARETVSRLLGRWEECGWIAESEGDLIVRDEGELRRIAGG